MGTVADRDIGNFVSVANRRFLNRVVLWGFIGVLLFAIALTVVTALPESSGTVRDVLTKGVYYLGPVAAIVLYMVGLRKAPKDNRRTQRWWAANLIMLAVASTVLGDAIWDVIAWVRHTDDVGIGLPDLFYMGQYVLLCVGVMLIPRPAVSGDSRFRVFLDSCTMALATTTVFWYFVFAPQVFQPGGDTLESSVNLAYSAFDVCMATSALLLLHHGFGQSNRTGFKILLSAIGINLVADLIYFFQNQAGTYHATSWLDILWPIAYMLMVLGAFVVRFGPASSELSGRRTPTLLQAVLPYVSIPVLFGLISLAFCSSHDKREIVGVVAGTGLTLAAIMLRQVFAMKENCSLLSEVNTAYSRLEDQSQQMEAQNEELMTLNEELDSAMRRLEDANRTLSSLATTDGLTGLPNQRAFQTRLREEISRASRQGKPLSVAMLDVDNFKSYNDCFGHPAGDEVLRLVGTALRDAVRSIDFLARYGGEEFVCILPDTPEAAAMEVCERMREAVALLVAPHRKVYVSIGIAGRESFDNGIQDILERADFALYTAKKQGKNIVVAHGNMPQEATEHLSEQAIRLEHSRALLGATMLAIETATGFNRSPKAAERDRRSLEGMLASLELRDVETEGHTERVMWMSLRLAVKLYEHGSFDMDPQFLRELALGALLHDIGKIGVSDQILHKPGRLDDNEFAMMRRHTVLGARFIERFPHLADALPVVRSHHEKWDGTGYPDCLSGADIPIAARIFSVLDAFDAMVTNRSYQDARSYSEVRDEICQEASAQFDPEIVRGFAAVPEDDWERIRSGDVKWVADAVRAALEPERRSA